MNGPRKLLFTVLKILLMLMLLGGVVLGGIWTGEALRDMLAGRKTKGRITQPLICKEKTKVGQISGYKIAYPTECVYIIDITEIAPGRLAITCTEFGKRYLSFIYDRDLKLVERWEWLPEEREEYTAGLPTEELPLPKECERLKGFFQDKRGNTFVHCQVRGERGLEDRVFKYDRGWRLKGIQIWGHGSVLSQ